MKLYADRLGWPYPHLEHKSYLKLFKSFAGIPYESVAPAAKLQLENLRGKKKVIIEEITDSIKNKEAILK